MNATSCMKLFDQLVKRLTQDRPDFPTALSHKERNLVELERETQRALGQMNYRHFL